MAKHSEARIVGQVTTVAVGLIVAACALSAFAGTAVRPHPEPGQPVVAARPAALTTASTTSGRLAAATPACSALACETDLATVAPPMIDLVWRTATRVDAASGVTEV